jgi:hypothetical protein
MKAIIGRTFGAVGIGATLLLAAGCRETSSVASAATVPAGTLVNCGEGRQAVVHPAAAGSGASQVECVAISGAASFAPVAVAQESSAPERVVVREKIVYRNASARRSRNVRTASQEPVSRTSDEPVYRSPGAEPVSYPERTSYPASYPSRGPVAEPVSYPDRSGYPDQSSRYPEQGQQKSPRSWKKTAIIIGGATAGGAGVGAILGGGSGAKKGAVLGAVAGAIYGIATRNK